MKSGNQGRLNDLRKSLVAIFCMAKCCSIWVLEYFKGVTADQMNLIKGGSGLISTYGVDRLVTG